MGIPFWFFILLGLAILSWVVQGFQWGSELILPALAFGGLLLRRILMMHHYQQQYRHYQQQKNQPSGAGASGTWSHAAGSAGTGGASGAYGSAGSFYSSFKGWGAGSQGAGYGQPQAAPLVKDPHTVLGVAKGASMEDIKKAYREKLKKYHPDIVANLHLGDEYKEMFEEKTREIQLAYEQLGGR